MTTFFAQTSDSSSALITGGGPIIPFAMLTVGDAWNDGLRARDLWTKLAGVGINHRAVCLFDPFSWSVALPQQHQKNAEGVYPFTGSHNTYQGVADLWSNRRVDIGAAVYAMQTFTNATHAGKDRSEAMRPTFVHDMTEGSHAIQYFPPDHPVFAETVPKMYPKPDIENGCKRLELRAFKAQARIINEALDRVEWIPTRVTIEQMHRTGVANDAIKSLTLTMYEPAKTAEHLEFIRKYKSRAVPWLDAASSDRATLCQAMQENGVEYCGVFCGNSGKLTDAYADGLDALHSVIHRTWGSN